MAGYAEEARRIIEDARFERMRILVWGPGDPGTDAPPERRTAYQKRQQIKDELKKRFPRAEVYFSEDAEMVEIASAILGQLRGQALQAQVADAVLILDVSRGADLELDHFVKTYAWFRDKVYVLLPEQHVGSQGLTKEILGLLHPEQIVGFSSQELQECRVASEKAIKVGDTVAFELRLRR